MEEDEKREGEGVGRHFDICRYLYTPIRPLCSQISIQKGVEQKFYASLGNQENQY